VAECLRKKNCSLASVKRLLHNIDKTGSADRKPGSGRRLIARTDENVNRVEDRLTERLIEEWSRFVWDIINRAVNRWRDRLH